MPQQCAITSGHGLQALLIEEKAHLEHQATALENETTALNAQLDLLRTEKEQILHGMDVRPWLPLQSALILTLHRQ